MANRTEKIKAPRKFKMGTYDENTGSRIGVTTYKKVGSTATGRTLYKETFKPSSNRKSVKGAVSASGLGKNKKLTSSKAKAKSITSDVGAGCFKGGKGCGPNK